MSAPLHLELTVPRAEFDVEAALDVEPGRPLALVGPNGAGKSTVLAAIAGLADPSRAVVHVGGRVLADTAARVALPAERRRIALVFQDFVLFPHLTVRDNVAFAARLRVGARRARDETAQWLDRYRLADLADRYPHQLSGGQAQRVALARAVASEPDVLLLDEPMASLDVETRDEVRAELAAHVREFSGPVIVVTHDRADVEALADAVVVLEAGVVTQRGTPAELAARPATPYVARLFGATRADDSSRDA